jgi:hypothetical protein
VGNKTLVKEESAWRGKKSVVYNTEETSQGQEGEKIKGSQSRVWQTQSVGTEDIKRV